MSASEIPLRSPRLSSRSRAISCRIAGVSGTGRLRVGNAKPAEWGEAGTEPLPLPVETAREGAAEWVREPPESADPDGARACARGIGLETETSESVEVPGAEAEADASRRAFALTAALTAAPTAEDRDDTGVGAADAGALAFFDLDAASEPGNGLGLSGPNDTSASCASFMRAESER
jgi:hypothetical protein